MGEPPYQITNERISKSAFIEDKAHNYVADITKRVADMTGLSMKSAETLQIVNYGVGGYYNLHFDFGPKDDKSFEDFGFGNRIATVLFYVIYYFCSFMKTTDIIASNLHKSLVLYTDERRGIRWRYRISIIKNRSFSQERIGCFLVEFT